MPDRPLERAHLSGEDLVGEVLRNMSEGIYRIRHMAIVPYLYRVYLHPDDYEPLRPIAPVIAEEMKRALDDKLAELRGSGKFRFVEKLSGKGPRPEFKRLSDEWIVEFYPDPDGKLEPGEVEIYSELGAQQKMEYGAGTMTRRIFKKQPETAATARVTPPAASHEPVLATIRYQDNSGAHTYPVTRNQVVIGRGGKAYWVDLKLDTLPDVSREHCRLRRDLSTGQFFLKDVSQFGTTIDGRRVPPSVEPADGESRDTQMQTPSPVETPLPPKARIGLAEVLFLEFEQQS